MSMADTIETEWHIDHTYLVPGVGLVVGLGVVVGVVVTVGVGVVEGLPALGLK